MSGSSKTSILPSWSCRRLLSASAVDDRAMPRSAGAMHRSAGAMHWSTGILILLVLGSSRASHLKFPTEPPAELSQQATARSEGSNDFNDDDDDDDDDFDDYHDHSSAATTVPPEGVADSWTVEPVNYPVERLAALIGQNDAFVRKLIPPIPLEIRQGGGILQQHSISDSAVAMSLQSLTLRWQCHCRV